jgi:alpha-L-fucosidase
LAIVCREQKRFEGTAFQQDFFGCPETCYLRPKTKAMHLKHLLLTTWFVVFFVPFASGQYQPTPSNLKNREEFQDARFGLFIHWGIYSTLGSGEWVLHNRKMKLSDYERLGPFFNPVQFNARQWVAMAKSAGMKYITITSRHHDGFAMFDSKVSDWDIIDRTPFKRDILKELAEECRKEGLKLFFYYSHLDWAHPDYFPRGNTGQSTGRPESGDWNKYLTYMNQQLTELLTQYGDVAGIWFDGWWDRKEAQWKLKEQYELIHRLQPQCLVGNNHHQPVKEGEDFQMFERDLPGSNTTGFSGESEVGKLPLEMCETMYSQPSSWGYQIDAKAFKSSKDLIGLLVKAAGYNSNFLLNVGPEPSGLIQKEFVDTLRKIGQWTARFGSTIYGTRGGPVSPQPWGVTTQKGNKIYVHIFNHPEKVLWIPLEKRKVKKVLLFGETQSVRFRSQPDGVLIDLPEKKPGDNHLILEMEM